ncbi:MAG: YdbH domain-containing protein [Minwuia sp.]|uniref:intermembrane phospholipid transport protein YdbH family protein n=1 Tax=Minwuia sp. TaxID=2493630 RepID=UPI003A898A03
MARRLPRRTTTIAAAGTLVLLAALVVGRLWIAERVIVWQLKAQGFETASVDVTALGPDRIELENLTAGPGYAVRRASIGFNVFALAVTDVDAEGIEAAAAWRDGALDFGPLDPLLDAGGGSAPSPAVEAGDIRFTLETGSGVLELDLPGRIAMTAGGAIRGDSAFVLTHPQITAAGTIETRATRDGELTTRAAVARLELRRDELPEPLDAADIELVLEVRPGLTGLRLTGSIPELSLNLAAAGELANGGEQLDLTLFADARDAAALRRLLPMAPAAIGSLSVSLGFTGSLPQGAAAPETWSAGLQGTATALIAANLDDVEGLADELAGSLDLEAAVAPDGVVLTVNHLDAALRGLAPGLLPPSVTSGPAAPLLGERLRLEIEPGARAALPPLADLARGAVLPLTLNGSTQIESAGRIGLAVRDAVLTEGRAEVARIEITGAGLPLDGQTIDSFSLAGRGHAGADIGFEGRLTAAAGSVTADGLTAEGLTVDMPLSIRGGPDNTVAALDGALVNAARIEGADFRLGEGSPGIRIDATATLGPCGLQGCDLQPRRLSARIAGEGITADVAGPGRIAAGEMVLTAAAERDADGGFIIPHVDLALSGLEAPGLETRGAIAFDTRGRFGEVLELDGTLSADLDHLKLAQGDIAGVKLDVPFAVRGDAEATRLQAPQSALSFAGLDWPGSFALEPGRAAASVGLDATLGPCTMAGCAPELQSAALRFVSNGLRFTVTEGQRVAVDRAELVLTARDARRRLGAVFDSRAMLTGISAPEIGSAASVTLDGRGRLDTLALDHALRADDVDIADEVVAGLPLLFLEGRVTGQGSRPVFTGFIEERGPGGLRVDTHADPASLRLRLTEEALPHVLELARATGVAFPAIELPAGRVSAELNLSTADANGQLEVTLLDAAGTVDPVRLEGVETTMRFRSLAPPLTDGPQPLRIALIDGALPLTDIEAALEIIRDGEGPAATVSGFRAGLMGGQARLDPFTVSTAPGPTDLVLRLDGVGLDAVAAALDVEGLSATGAMSGALPVFIDAEERVAVRGGKLTADAPGTLGLPVEFVRGSLSAQLGDKADILLNALEDFHFTKLDIGLEKDFGGEAEMQIRLEGANPAHLDGHPFVFNINVTGNADRLVETILAIYRATSGVIESGVETIR